MRKFYQAISVIFHPTLILALLLILTLYLSFANIEQFWTWMMIGFGMIYGIPGVYYFTLLARHKTDVDVKNQLSREAILKVSVISLASIFVLSLFLSEAEILQKLLLAGIANSLLYVIVINMIKFEVSVHVGSLSALIIFLTYYFSTFYLIGLIPVLMTAVSRYKLKKHSALEIIGGIVATSGIYLLILTR